MADWLQHKRGEVTPKYNREWIGLPNVVVMPKFQWINMFISAVASVQMNVLSQRAEPRIFVSPEWSEGWFFSNASAVLYAGQSVSEGVRAVFLWKSWSAERIHLAVVLDSLPISETLIRPDTSGEYLKHLTAARSALTAEHKWTSNETAVAIWMKGCLSVGEITAA